MQLDDATTILGRADFFEVCDAEQRRLLAFASERKKWRAGSVIYQAGDVPDGAQVLVSGTIATYQQGDDAKPFGIATSGATLGAMSLVVAKPRPVTVKVRDEYGGCRSWLEITRDLPFEGTPVLADEEVERASEAIAAIASAGDRQPVLV